MRLALLNGPYVTHIGAYYVELPPVENARPVLGRFYDGAGGVYIGRDLEYTNITTVLVKAKDAAPGKLVQSVAEGIAYVKQLAADARNDYKLPTAEELTKIFHNASDLVGIDHSNEHAERWCLVRDERSERFYAVDIYSGQEAEADECDWLCAYAINRVWVN